MLEIRCDRCKKQVNKPSALVFSPPYKIANLNNDTINTVTDKFHICLKCWDELKFFLNNKY